MDAQDFAVQHWLKHTLARYGQHLIKTPDGHKDFKRLGKWSRWGKRTLLETHVNLHELQSRVLERIEDHPAPLTHLGRRWE